MLKNARLSTKLLGGFIVVALIVAIVAGIGWYGVNSAGKQIDYLTVTIMPSIRNLLTMSDALNGIKAAERSLLLPNLSQQLTDRQLSDIPARLTAAEQAMQVYEETPHDDEALRRWGEVKAAWNAWLTDHEQYMGLYQQYAASKNAALATTMLAHNLEQEATTVNTTIDLLQDLLEYTKQAADNAKAEANSLAERLTWIVIAGAAVGAVLAVVLGVTLGLSISRPLMQAVGSLGESSEQVAAASEQLSSTSQQIAGGNNELASSVEETSSTLEEASSMVQQNTENTRQAASLAGLAKDAADKGNREMQEMQAAMKEIKKSSDQIAKIVKVVDEIAFQTNILALNAAVEAARAGDVGMGFAVVAEEVRSLAQRSAQAAKDTADIIESNIQLSERGMEVSARAAESLAEITVQARKVNELMDEIAAASQEQAQGIHQINRAITQMEQVTQQNAAGSEEAATAAEELSSQAENMQGIVLGLERLVEGARVDVRRQARFSQAQAKVAPVRKAAAGAGREALVGTRPGKGKQRRPEDIIPLEEDQQGF